MITINTPKDYLKFVLATFIISSVVWIAIDIYNTYQENYSDFDEKEEWITYTNTNYGYEISYPESVEFVRSSELDHPKAKTKAGEEDQLVLIGDYAGKVIYSMTAGVSIDYSANNIDELHAGYVSVVIPQLINGESGEGLDLKKSDFVINEIEFNGRPAIEVLKPLSYEISTFNKNGNVFFVLANGYTGATTTSKDRNTRAIMETFRVLD